MSFFTELNRRNVFKVGIAYSAAAWLLLQIVNLVLDYINAPDWIMQVFMLGLAVGLPIAVIAAWVFELTPEGIRLEKNVDPNRSIARHTGQQLNRGIIMILSMATVLLLTDRFREEPTIAKPVAVLPFFAMSNGPDIEEALDHVTADYIAAAEYANNPEQRVAAEIDLAFITGNWRGLPNMMARFFEMHGCVHSNWVSTIAPTFGYAEKFLVKAREERICDPLVSHSWFTETRAALWTGNPAVALEIAHQGDKVAPGAWLNSALIRTLSALQEFEQVENEISTRIQQPEDVKIFRFMLAAARGDRQRAEALFKKYLLDPNHTDFWKLIMYAWIGDKENTNRMAAEIDQLTYGPVALVSLAYWCACGAPWEIIATPNFAGKVKQAGFSWPPASPIQFPLKNW